MAIPTRTRNRPWSPKVCSADSSWARRRINLCLYQHKGPVWKDWSKKMKEFLISSQKKNGKDEGSWDPKGDHGSAAGRVVVTAMATLSLEIYYRYLPMYQAAPEE